MQIKYLLTLIMRTKSQKVKLIKQIGIVFFIVFVDYLYVTITQILRLLLNKTRYTLQKIKKMRCIYQLKTQNITILRPTKKKKPINTIA